MHPGIVNTNVMVNSNSSLLMRFAFAFINALPFVGRTPDEFAPIPVWVATSEEVKEKTQKGIYDFDHNGKEAAVVPAAKDDTLRVKLWEKLVGLTEGNPQTV